MEEGVECTTILVIHIGISNSEFQAMIVRLTNYGEEIRHLNILSICHFLASS